MGTRGPSDAAGTTLRRQGARHRVPDRRWACLSQPVSGPRHGERPAPLSFINRGGVSRWKPCSSNWKGAGNPSVWRALEPLFERSVIFQSNSLPKPLFIKYSWDPFSPGTPSPRLSPKNQSGSSACSNASCVFGSLGLPSPPPASPHLPPSLSPPRAAALDGAAQAAWGRHGSRRGKERD